VGLREARGATAQRVEEELAGAARPQGRVRDAGERPGADEADGAARDRTELALDEVERDGDDGASRRTEPRRRGDLARHPARGPEQAVERCGDGPVTTRVGDRGSHLPGDLGLAHDHRLETGGDGEQVARDVVTGASAKAHGRVGCRPEHRTEQLARMRGGTLGVGCVEVELDPVARREQHGAVGDVLHEELARKVERDGARPLELLEGDVEVTDAGEGEGMRGV
jgi:hypothetical protein